MRLQSRGAVEQIPAVEVVEVGGCGGGGGCRGQLALVLPGRGRGGGANPPHCTSGFACGILPFGSLAESHSQI